MFQRPINTKKTYWVVKLLIISEWNNWNTLKYLHAYSSYLPEIGNTTGAEFKTNPNKNHEI